MILVLLQLYHSGGLMLTHSGIIWNPTPQNASECKRSMYQMDLSATGNGNHEKANLLIKLKNPNILTIVDEYSYDLQSFIGEVGGTLGLFLGLSMFSCIEFIEYVLRKLCSKNVY